MANIIFRYREDLNALFNQREEKIKKYKEKKALEEKLNSMKNVINEASDDETVVRTLSSEIVFNIRAVISYVLFSHRLSVAGVKILY